MSDVAMLDTLGIRLKNLRTRAGLTRAAVAERTGLSAISILRYENNTVAPSVHALAALAVQFDVTADYLLGLEREDGQKINQQAHIVRIAKVLNNQPIEGEDYYWIEYKPTTDGETVELGGQTMWIGWNEDMSCELRVLRPVIAPKAIKACIQVFGQPMVINDLSDLNVYLQFGGHAIARCTIIEKYLPIMLEPIEVKRGWEREHIENQIGVLYKNGGVIWTGMM